MDKQIHGCVLGLITMGMALFLTACGGAGGAASTNAPDDTSTEVSVQGNWSGTYTASGSKRGVPIYALIQKDGDAFFYDSTGVMYHMPRFNGSYSVDGSVTAYSSPGYTFSDGSTRQALTLSATAADSQIAGDVDAAGNTDPRGNDADVQLLPLETFQGTPGIDAGQWSGYYVSPSPFFVGLNVDADGSMNGQDVFGCQLSGRLTQLGEGSTLFSVTLRSSGPSTACGKDFTGLAHETQYDTFGYFNGESGTYYYLGVTNADSAFVAEFKVD